MVQTAQTATAMATEGLPPGTMRITATPMLRGVNGHHREVEDTADSMDKSRKDLAVGQVDPTGRIVQPTATMALQTLMSMLVLTPTPIHMVRLHPRYQLRAGPASSAIHVNSEISASNENHLLL